MKCTCVSTCDGWDETNCPYHGKPKKPFIRFRMMLGSSAYIVPSRYLPDMFIIARITKVRA